MMIVESLSNKGKEQYLVKRDSTRQLVKRVKLEKESIFSTPQRKKLWFMNNKKNQKILTEEESERKVNKRITFHHKFKIKKLFVTSYTVC